MNQSRRLAVVVFSDIKKSTEKMYANEDLMMKMLHEHEVIFRKISLKFGGRIIKDRGDGFMIEFASATQAVKCCMSVQNAFRVLNEDKTEEEQIQIRIGIHFGEVIQKGSDLFGIAVNEAARLEPLAEPGGICMSRNVYDSIKSTFNLDVIETELVQLKGIDEPRRIFKISSLPLTDLDKDAAPDSSDTDEISLREKAKDVPPSSFNIEKDHEKAKIAVLPFKVLSPNPEDAYLGESFASAIIFELAKEKSLHVQQLENLLSVEEHGYNIDHVIMVTSAAYVINGTFQKLGSILRLQINLLNSVNKEDVFSKSLTLSEDKIFDVLQELINTIVYHIVFRVSGEHQAYLSVNKPQNSAAGNLYLKGLYLESSSVSWAEKSQAIEVLENAVNADNTFPLAHIALAKAYSSVYGRWRSDRKWLEKALSHADKASNLSTNITDIHETYAEIYLKAGDNEKVFERCNQAMKIRSESTRARKILAEMFIKKGQLDSARVILEEAIEYCHELHNRLEHAEMLNRIAFILFLKGKFDESIGMYKEALALASLNENRFLQTGILYQLGVIYRNIGKTEKALDLFEKCYLTLKELGDRKYTANLLGSIGTTYATLGKFEEATSKIDEGLAISHEIGDQLSEAIMLSQKAKILNRLGKNNDAISMFLHAVEIYKQLENKVHLSKTLINLAATYCDIGDFQQASETYNEARELVSEYGDYAMLGSVLLNIGEISEFTNKPQEALNLYNEAQRIFNKVPKSQYRIYQYLFRGRVLYLLKEYQKAMSDLAQLLDQEKIPVSIMNRAIIYHTLSASQNEYKDDLETKVLDAMEGLEKLGSYPELIESYRVIGAWYIKNNLPQKAKPVLLKGLELALESAMKWEEDNIRNLLT